MEVPCVNTFDKAVEVWGLKDFIPKNLKKEGIASFFPVQYAVVPILIKANERGCIIPRDVCVSAPTGSGKTLSFAIPIIQTLANRTVTRLRALVLLPSRELAAQVHKVFIKLAKGSDLSVGLATGQQQDDFEHEQSALTGQSSGNRKRSLVDSLISNDDLYDMGSRSLGCSAVDILVCTPGRLLDHLQYTKGFTLQHLRFLVLDEADRLLSNAYHHWVRSLVKSVQSTSYSRSSQQQSTGPTQSQHSDEGVPPMGLQRLLFSATLSDNPGKLSLFGIRNPLVIRVAASIPSSTLAPAGIENGTQAGEEGETDIQMDSSSMSIPETAAISLPQSLLETTYVCEAADRPLLLAAILYEASRGSPEVVDSGADSENNRHSHIGCAAAEGDLCLVFTSSVETAHRLSVLLASMNEQSGNDGGSSMLYGGRVEGMSRLTHAKDREEIMAEARTGTDIKVLVSSDHMARGIDLSNIKLVINYDPPSHAKTYVHRVGRTARAHRHGQSITMLKAGQVGAFKKMRRSLDGEVKEHKQNHQKLNQWMNPSNSAEEITTTVVASAKEVKVVDKWMSKCRVRSTTVEMLRDEHNKALLVLAEEK